MTGTKKLPGNQGQFGVGDATEAYTPLPDYTPPEPSPPSPEGNRGEGGGGDAGGGAAGGGEGG